LAEKNIVDKYPAYLLSKIDKIKDRQKSGVAFFILTAEMTKKERSHYDDHDSKKKKNT
jgi:hypothetical protein